MNTIYAQSQDSLSLDSTTLTVYASPVFVHASRLDNPFAISSIDQDKIKLLTEPTIEPLLNSTPGLWMQTGALNTNRISIRGVGYREPFATTGIKVYLDEIPLTNGTGEASIEDIHPLILSGIDIWRGPASALWGSGLGGMIHLKSRMPGKDLWQTRIQAGSFDRFQLDQHFAKQYGKNDQWGTGLHYQFLNDAGYRVNNHYTKHSVTWMQHWKNDNGWSLNTFVHGIDLKAYIPSSINLDDYENNPSAAAPTWDAVHGNEDYSKWITGLNLLYNSSKSWVYRGSVFGNFFDSDEVRPFNVLKENNTSFGMRHRFTFQVKQAGHITAGVEYFDEHYAFSTYQTLPGGIAGDQLSDYTEENSYINGFIQSEWSLGSKWYAFAGLTTSVTLLSFEESETDLPVGIYPTIGLNYKWMENLSMSASLSRGYSALALNDVLNADGAINPDILPESGWSRELSMMFGSDESSFVRLNAFWMNIDNTVITIQNIDDFEKLNGGSTLHKGIELEYKWMALPGFISLEGAYTYGDYTFSDFEKGSKANIGNQLPGTPTHHGFNRLNFFTTSKLNFHLDHHWISETYLNDSNTVTGDGFQLINLGVNYQVQLGGNWSSLISASLQNVFNEKYSSMYQINAPGSQPRYYYPGKPRSFYLTLSIDHDL